MKLLEPLALGPRTAPNRVMFGPHVTNLGDDDRCFTARHVAYYERRARGGCGTIVVEGASVHESDWPYERAPLAARAEPGWAAIVAACRPHGALVLASLDHAGGQGSSAYSQAPLWAPSRVPEVASREVPKWMEPEDIAAVIDGFAAAAQRAVAAGCDGVEINAGQHSLIRQFLSGLTNHRDDEWGADRSHLARSVIGAVRRAIGPDVVVGLRLSCDELAPWAGITPEMAPGLAAELVDVGVDHLVVVAWLDLLDRTDPSRLPPAGRLQRRPRRCRQARGRRARRAAGLGRRRRPGRVGARRVRRSAALRRRRDDPRPDRRPRHGRQGARRRARAHPAVHPLQPDVPGARRPQPARHVHRRADLRTGDGGPRLVRAGEARHATCRSSAADRPAWRRHGSRRPAATVSSSSSERPTLGGMAAVAGPNGALVDWLAREVERLGVDVRTGSDDVPPGTAVVQCTGSITGHPRVRGRRRGGRDRRRRPAPRRGDAARPRRRRRVRPDRRADRCRPRRGARPASRPRHPGQHRRQRAGPQRRPGTGQRAPRPRRRAHRTARPAVRVEPEGVTVGDRYSGAERLLPCAALVDCGFRLPSEPIPGAVAAAGDCVAPRTVHEAILEGRRVALAL